MLKKKPLAIGIGIGLSAKMVDALDELSKTGDFSRSYLIRFALEETYGIENDIGFGNIKKHAKDSQNNDL